MQSLQRAVVGPSDEVLVDRAPGRQVLRNRAPLTSGAEDVHHPVRHLADIDRAPVAATFGRRNQRPDLAPLRLGQIALVTSARIAYLYDLMDAAYDAAAIHDRGKALGHMPIIDRNFRAQHEAKAEWAREVERMKLIHMPDPHDVIFDFRTMAERINARLKDEFGARFVRVRGAIKVKCHLVFGVVALAVDQILRVANFRPAPA